MYDNTLGFDLYPDCRVLRLDTKAQATQNGYNRTVGECEIESELGKSEQTDYTQDTAHTIGN